jgi:phage terminase large subunit-like protein
MLMSNPAPVKVYLPSLHEAQREAVQDAQRFNVVCCGRRWGKTFLGVDRLVNAALHGHPVAWMSPTYRMLTEVWRSVRNILSPVSLVVQQQQHRIELLTNGVVEMWSLDNPDAIRGRKYQMVVIDEAAMVRDLGGIWNAVIRPTLTDLRGGAWMLSTPKGRNFFWGCYQHGQEGTDGWASWQMPTDRNPHLDSKEVQMMRESLPEMVARQEIDAEPVTDGGGVFRNVHDCTTATLQPKPKEGHVYVAGMDIGRTNDFSVVAVIDATTNEVVHIDRYTGIGFALQEERVKAVCECYRPDVVIVELNNFGYPFVESLVAQGLPVRPFKTTATTKSHIIEKLALAFEHQLLAIPNDKTLMNELLGYEVETTPAGLTRYGAPVGQHDDMVMALAFAWYAAEGR